MQDRVNIRAGYRRILCALPIRSVGADAPGGPYGENCTVQKKETDAATPENPSPEAQRNTASISNRNIAKSVAFVNHLIIAIFSPFDRIRVDVFPYFAIVLLVSNHMLMKGSLPDVMAQSPIDEPFYAPIASETVGADALGGPLSTHRIMWIWLGMITYLST